MPPSVIFASLHLSSRHFTSPPILSASVCLTSRHFTSPPIHFASLHLTSCHFASPHLSFPASLHATSFHTHFVCLTSRHIVPLHLTYCSLCTTSPHFMPLHFTSHSFCITSPHSLHVTSLHLLSARFSQKVVSGKKPPTPKNLAAHLKTMPLTPKNLVAKNATRS